MVEDLRELRGLAADLGVARRYVDGLGTQVEVSADTLIAVCAALGQAVARPGDAAEARRSLRRQRAGELLPTFNDPPTEPSPYSPVSRLFWTSLMIDLGPGIARDPAPQRANAQWAGRVVNTQGR